MGFAKLGFLGITVKFHLHSGWESKKQCWGADYMYVRIIAENGKVEFYKTYAMAFEWALLLDDNIEMFSK